jgi:hypothetical protein
VAEVVVTPVASTKVMESPVAKARVSSSSTPTKNIGAFGLTWAGDATDGSGTNMPATFDDLYGEEGGREARPPCSRRRGDCAGKEKGAAGA